MGEREESWEASERAESVSERVEGELRREELMREEGRGVSEDEREGERERRTVGDEDGEKPSL
jgi:hypothetical protein